MISIIVAYDQNKTIGLNNKMPWHFSKDMKYFKQTTMGHPVIMGRKTFDSIPEQFRPLKGRQNIVLTHNKSYSTKHSQIKIMHSIEEVLQYCQHKECFIIGGASIYRQFLSYADKLYITHIEHSYKGDAFFPEINWQQYKKIYETKETEKGIILRFAIYQKVNSQLPKS